MIVGGYRQQQMGKNLDTLDSNKTNKQLNTCRYLGIYFTFSHYYPVGTKSADRRRCNTWIGPNEIKNAPIKMSEKNL